jgi:hypothetical protein
MQSVIERKDDKGIKPFCDRKGILINTGLRNITTADKIHGDLLITTLVIPWRLGMFLPHSLVLAGMTGTCRFRCRSVSSVTVDP